MKITSVRNSFKQLCLEQHILQSVLQPASL